MPVDARGVRAAAGRGQDDVVRGVRGQVRAVHPRVQRDRPDGGHEQRASVHVGHDELSDERGRGRVREDGRDGAQTGEYSAPWPDRDARFRCESLLCYITPRHKDAATRRSRVKRCCFKESE